RRAAGRPPRRTAGDSSTRPGIPARCAGAGLRRGTAELAAAGPAERSTRGEPPGPRAEDGRQGRLADAEPDSAGGSLSRLVEGGAGGNAAQLPLHAPGD